MMIALMEFYLGCSDPEGSTGSNVLGEHLTGIPRELIIYPEIDTLSWTETTTGTSNYLHLGNALGYHSSILIKFTSFPDLKDTFLLDSAILTLRPNQVFRDSIIYHNGEVQLSWITNAWSEASVILDSLPSWESYPALETPIFITAADSDSLVISLPPDTVRNWIDGDSSNQGFRLQMTNQSGFIRQYFSSEAVLAYRPTLFLYYTWWDSGASGWVTYQSDTTAYPSDDAFIVWNDLPITEDVLMIGNGVGYRSLLKFNLADSLPIFGTSIHEANLTFHLKEDDPLNFRSVSSALRQKLESLSWIDDPLHPDISSLAGPAVLIGDSTLVISLSLYVRDWVNDPSQNFGVLIRSDNPGWDIAREVFYSRAAVDSSKRPSLQIVYTTVE
jgi:hypothetical protein